MPPSWSARRRFPRARTPRDRRADSARAPARRSSPARIPRARGPAPPLPAPGGARCRPLVFAFLGAKVGAFLFVTFNLIAGPHLDPARRARHREIRLAPGILPALTAGESGLTLAAAFRAGTVGALEVEPPSRRSKLGEGISESTAGDDVVGHRLPRLLTAH